MKVIRDRIKRALPSSQLETLRDRRDWLKDIGGYFLVRRQFADNSLAAAATASLRSAFRPSKTILFYPQRPQPYRGATEYRLCALLGYAVTSDPTRRFDVAFRRQNATFSDPRALQKIPVSRSEIINAGSLDISKRAVAKAVADVFGYQLEIDPTQYHGRIVEKSNRNGAHDGRVLEGPIPPQHLRPGCVYQREIDNTSDKDGWVLDYRLPVYGEDIPLVFLKYRPVKTRFSKINSFGELGEPRQLFSRTELDNVLLLARKMGIDYAELDVLRDRDGRIYVVDANTTPVGPPKGLPEPERKTALKRLAESFAQLLEQWAHGQLRSRPRDGESTS